MIVSCTPVERVGQRHRPQFVGISEVLRLPAQLLSDTRHVSASSVIVGNADRLDADPNQQLRRPGLPAKARYDAGTPLKQP